MKYFLLLIPLFTSLFGVALYKIQDKRIEIFRLDFVQFVYMFLLAPTMYVWLKSFLFYILRNELEFRLSVTDLFVVDTTFSVLAFIVMAAIAMHTLTKTFWLKRHHDPEFDIYHLSEYFHLWWTHIVIWGGAMLLATFVSISNVLIPFQIVAATKLQFYSLLTIGLILGPLTFFAIWMSDAKQGNFMRLMKLILAVFLLVHVLVYFVLDPVFNMTNAGYWFVFANFFSATLCASFFERYEKTNRLLNFFIHIGWGDNKGIDLFAGKKKK
ncbi:MAG: hypothetical protein BroJett025_08980 [Patescibacteria group bacterium]|nr:MAG: hypothetical protein BroJett025_08980 [Patescibacteria group bacterium]